jgi:hypothetical protein
MLLSIKKSFIAKADKDGQNQKASQFLTGFLITTI